MSKQRAPMKELNGKGKTRKSMIFEEAARLFREKGYQATSMRDLAERVELEPSSLYSHIRSKGELLQKICFDCANHFTASMNEIMAEETTALEKIRKLVEVHIDIALTKPTSTTVFNDEWKNLPPHKLVRFMEMRKEYERKFIDLIKEAQDRQEVIPVEPELLLNTIISSFRWIQPKTSIRDKWKHGQIVRAISRFILGGLTNINYQLP